MVHFRTDSHAVRVGLRIRVARAACKKTAAAGTERNAAGRGPTLAPAVDAPWQSEGAMSHTGAEPSEEPKKFGSLPATNGSPRGAIGLIANVVE